MATIIIKLEHSNLLQHSREGVKIQKIVSSISPLTFIKLLFKADTKVNPRTATVNPITKSIYETLDKSPELFWYKTKGILLSTEECEILDRGRVRISLDNADYEGIMDGGHNTFAIARFIIDKLYGISFKTWDECKKFWDENYDNVLERFEQVKEQFKFSIPIEILSPSDEIGALDEFYDYISEICSARNNNVQLRETAKGNQVGYYEYLKDKLYDYKIIWKTGSIGKIKAEDVISLATLPLLFLQDKGLLPQDIKTLNKISIYSQKSKCVDYFNEVLAHSAVSEGEKGKYILKNEIVKSALDLVEDIIKFYDKLYFEFPDLYGTSHGKFGRIGEVKIKENSPLSNMRICDINRRMKSEVLFVAVQRNGEVIIPNGNTVIYEKDRVTLTGSTTQLEKFFIRVGILSDRTVNEVMIVGGGRITYYLTNMLLELGMDVKIIEINKDKCVNLVEKFPQATVIHGDGTDHELLLSESLEEMDAFIALTDNDEENVIISMFAQSHGVTHVLPKVNRVSLGFLLDKLGLENSITPKFITANQIVQYVRAMQNTVGSNVESLIKLVNDKVEALEFRVRDNCRFIDVPIKDLNIRKGIIIAYVTHKGVSKVATGDTRIQLSDTVIIISKVAGLRDINDLLS